MAHGSSTEGRGACPALQYAPWSEASGSSHLLLRCSSSQHIPSTGQLDRPSPMIARFLCTCQVRTAPSFHFPFFKSQPWMLTAPMPLPSLQNHCGIPQQGQCPKRYMSPWPGLYTHVPPDHGASAGGAGSGAPSGAPVLDLLGSILWSLQFEPRTTHMNLCYLENISGIRRYLYWTEAA